MNISDQQKLGLNDVFVVIDQNNQINECTEDNNKASASYISLKVTDETGQVNYQNFYLSAAATNDPVKLNPVVNPINVQAEIPYTLILSVTDPDKGDYFSYKLESAPVGASINSRTGTLIWTPDNTQAGENFFNVSVTDSFGNKDTTAFTITVDVANANLLSTSQGNEYWGMFFPNYTVWEYKPWTENFDPRDKELSLTISSENGSQVTLDVFGLAQQNITVPSASSVDLVVPKSISTPTYAEFTNNGGR